MAAKTKSPLRAVRAVRARITIHQVGAQYRVRVDGEWQDTYHTADGARRRADVLAAKIALSPSALPPGLQARERYPRLGDLGQPGGRRHRARSRK